MDPNSNKGSQFRVYINQRNRNINWAFDYIKDLLLLFIGVISVLSYSLKPLSYTLKSSSLVILY